MSRAGNCWDNAPVESFLAALKKELVAGEAFYSRAQWGLPTPTDNLRTSHQISDSRPLNPELLHP